MRGDELREWGDWTELKLDILTQYLNQFTTASKGVNARVFLDAFAGEGRGRSRTTGEVFEGSARIALNISDPEFTHLRYFELDPANGHKLRRDLKTEYPGRNIKVVDGDCNDRIPEVLAELTPLNWAPTFAFLDPDGIQLRWSTLRALARHKQRSRYKIELWLLFSTMGLVRRLALDESKMRLETELGYAHTFALEIRNDRGSPIYALVFATDNEAGKRIMLHLYEEAARAAPRRRELVKAKRDGALQMQFGLGDEVALRDPLWKDAPWQPPT